MKSAPASLINFLNQVIGYNDGQLVFAEAFSFTLRNGTVLAYTNSEISFAYDGVTYLGNNVLIDGLKYKASIGLEVDKQQISIAARPDQTIAANAPFLQALRDGGFDGCEVTRTRVFWSDVIGGTLIGGVILFKGRLGAIDEIGRVGAKLAVNSDLVLLDIDMPRNVYQPTCLHTLYDAGCTLSKAAFSAGGTVGAASTASLVNWSGASLSYQQGTITFTSGVNSGVTGTIGSAVAGVSLALIYPLQSPPSTGDAFTVAFGCDHTPATCKARFNNLTNFRGFPYVPPPQMAV